MPDESGWSNVSFTPHGQSTVRFGNVRVTFPSIDSLLEEYEELDREDLLGPIGIRIEPLSNGALATFPEGQVGIFQGRVPETGLIFATGNAKIYISTVEKLVLSAESADGVTSPIAVASDDRPD